MERAQLFRHRSCFLLLTLLATFAQAKIMTGEYAAQPRTSDSDNAPHFRPNGPILSPTFSPPTAPVLYRGRFHRGRVPYWCGTIANGPPTPPQWCGTIPHGQSVSFTSLRQIPRASRALVPSRLRRFLLPPCGARLPSVSAAMVHTSRQSLCTFLFGESQRLAPPSGVPPSVASVGGSEYLRPPGLRSGASGTQSSPA